MKNTLNGVVTSIGSSNKRRSGGKALVFACLSWCLAGKLAYPIFQFICTVPVIAAATSAALLHSFQNPRSSDLQHGLTSMALQ